MAATAHAIAKPAAGTGAEDAIAAFRLLDAPGHLLRRCHQRSYEIFTACVGADGLTRQQFATLLALAQNEGSTQKQLAEIAGFDKSTLKEMMARLVAKGLVERRPSSSDNRALDLRATPAAHDLLRKMIPAVYAAQEEILTPLPPELRPAFLYCLRLLIADQLPR